MSPKVRLELDPMLVERDSMPQCAHNWIRSGEWHLVGPNSDGVDGIPGRCGAHISTCTSNREDELEYENEPNPNELDLHRK